MPPAHFARSSARAAEAASKAAMFACSAQGIRDPGIPSLLFGAPLAATLGVAAAFLVQPNTALSEEYQPTAFDEERPDGEFF